jgi:2'-5' RNA ligase
MRKQPVTIYWLMPAEPYRELFRELIRILAKEFDAPKFEAHLTIVRAEDRQSPQRVLRQINGAPVRLRVRGIGFSAKFTKTLFTRFYSAKSLDKLIIDLGGNRKSSRDPHISLIYKRLPARVKKVLASTIKLSFREVVFDSIKAMRCISPTETRAEVESWHTLASRRLRG